MRIAGDTFEVLKISDFGKNYLQTHGTAMGTKFANIFMAEIETKLINQSNTKPLKWKRYIDYIFSLWDSNIQEIDLFMKQANNFHPTIKFTVETSETEITFLYTVISKGERFRNESIHPNTLQADWNLPVHIFHLEPPTRREKRFH